MKIENLRKSYSQNIVFENFDLEIEENKITCVLGESGSGKTTLLNVVAGLTDFEGIVPKVRCSYVFQEPRLIPNLTVYNNLKIVCSDESKIRASLERAGISDKASSYPNELSGGQAQRVSVLRAFLFDSQIILMDEPFSSLDLKLKIKMMEFYKDLHKETHRTSLFVTHDVDEAICLADRIIVISHGKMTLDTINQNVSGYGANSAVRERLINTLLLK